MDDDDNLKTIDDELVGLQKLLVALEDGATVFDNGRDVTANFLIDLRLTLQILEAIIYPFNHTTN